MHRFIDQLNVSITTNRGCNLRCAHCYILPHVFKDPRMMSEDTVRRIFDRVEELHALDGNLREVEWEVIGGETTLMPFEWWEKMLPYMLERIADLNRRLEIPGSLNFLTNLMIRDTRYFDLFNAYGAHPAFALYTSWEPDTRRFGTRNKLFPKFLANLDRLRLPGITLDVIMTREVIRLGGAWVVDTFVPHGITDFSCKMLSPYGSGRAFFAANMIDFAAMSRFLAELDAACPEGVGYTPGEEMLSSLFRGTSFQCNGNFYYDLSIEPDGLTHFNANQTAEEAAVGGLEVRIEDPLWARKVILENSREASGKLNLKHPECHQCAYLRYCNAGWWHYKVDPDLVVPFREEECAGLRRHWDAKRAALQTSLHDISRSTHLREMRAALRAGTAASGTGGLAVPAPARAAVSESALQDLDAFLALDPACHRVRINRDVFLGKTVPERMTYYDARGFEVTLDPALISGEAAIAAKDLEAILLNQVCLVHRRATPLNEDQVIAIATAYPGWSMVMLMQDAAHALEAALAERAGVGGSGTPDRGLHGPEGPCPSGLVPDSRNEELFRWLLCHPRARAALAALPVPTGGADAPRGSGSRHASGRAYLARLIDTVERERRAAGQPAP